MIHHWWFWVLAANTYIGSAAAFVINIRDEDPCTDWRREFLASLLVSLIALELWSFIVLARWFLDICESD